MLGRLLTALFYAAFFFWLGAWSGGRLEPIGDALYKGAIKTRDGAEALWHWAFRSGDDDAGEGEAYSVLPQVADLGNARRAFSRGDIQAAVAEYKAYLATHTEDADAHGELGNVYYHSGQVGQASGSFYTAALLLLSEGRKEEAEALMPAITAGAPGLAAELRTRLSLASSSTGEQAGGLTATPSLQAPAAHPATESHAGTQGAIGAAPATH